MSKSKQENLMNLVEVAFRIDEKVNMQDIRTKELQRMALLAKAGKDDTDEFKALQFKHSKPIVSDFTGELAELRKIVGRLKKYTFNF